MPNTNYRLSRLGSALAGGLVSLWPRTASADALDIAWWLTRVGGWQRSPVRAALFVFALAVANYVLNVVFMLRPAMRSGASARRVMLDLVGFTVIAQLADRVGMLACSLVGLAVGYLGGVGDRYFWLLVTGVVASNFIVSGILIWFLARHFMSRRWGMPRTVWFRGAFIVAIATNPAWAFALSFTSVFTPVSP